MIGRRGPALQGFDESYTRYQANRSLVRRFIRKAYLRSARSKLQGAVLDFGCGIGELLETLPVGSMGLEYNRSTVEHCQGRGLDVGWYDGFSDGWQLTAVPAQRRFDSMIVSHVLEHLDQPMAILHELLGSAARIGIWNVLVVVPGRVGYRTDQTHVTFVDRAMLGQESVVAGTGFRMISGRYFPGNVRGIGDWFTHHELQVLYRRERD